MKYKKQKRHFEKSGQVVPEVSYYTHLENVTNTDNQDIKTMVDLGRYFSIFAPRQSGKTTYFKYFCRLLDKDPTYTTIFLSFQRYNALDRETFYHSVQKKLYSRLISRLEEVRCPHLGKVSDFLNSHELTDSNSFFHRERSRSLFAVH